MDDLFLNYSIGFLVQQSQNIAKPGLSEKGLAVERWFLTSLLEKCFFPKEHQGAREPRITAASSDFLPLRLQVRKEKH